MPRWKLTPTRKPLRRTSPEMAFVSFRVRATIRSLSSQSPRQWQGLTSSVENNPAAVDVASTIPKVFADTIGPRSELLMQ
jgi:hypothetical protein